MPSYTELKFVNDVHLGGCFMARLIVNSHGVCEFKVYAGELAVSQAQELDKLITALQEAREHIVESDRPAEE